MGALFATTIRERQKVLFAESGKKFFLVTESGKKFFLVTTSALVLPTRVPRRPTTGRLVRWPDTQSENATGG
jgi:hypothetical protein